MENTQVEKKLEKNNGKKEEGASLVEYALLVALIAVVAIAGIRTLGTNINAQYSGLAGSLASR
jgi:pilus assembly protein Flp/PilA